MPVKAAIRPYILATRNGLLDPLGPAILLGGQQSSRYLYLTEQP